MLSSRTAIRTWTVGGVNHAAAPSEESPLERAIASVLFSGRRGELVGWADKREMGPEGEVWAVVYHRERTGKGKWKPVAAKHHDYVTSVPLTQSRKSGKNSTVFERTMFVTTFWNWTVQFEVTALVQGLCGLLNLARLVSTNPNTHLLLWCKASCTWSLRPIRSR